MASPSRMDSNALAKQRDDLVKLRTEIQSSICETGTFKAARQVIQVGVVADDSVMSRAETGQKKRQGQETGTICAPSSIEESIGNSQELQTAKVDLRKMKRKYKDCKAENNKLAKEKERMSEMLIQIKSKIAQAESTFSAVNDDFEKERDSLLQELSMEREKVKTLEQEKVNINSECERKIEKAKSGIVHELKEMNKIHQDSLQEKEDMRKVLKHSEDELAQIRKKLEILEKEYSQKANKISIENSELKRELVAAKNDKNSTNKLRNEMKRALQIVQSKQNRLTTDYQDVKENTQKELSGMRDFLNRGNQEVIQRITSNLNSLSHVEKLQCELDASRQEEERLKIHLEKTKQSLQETMKQKHEADVRASAQTKDNVKLKRKLDTVLAKKTHLEEEFEKYKKGQKSANNNVKSDQSPQEGRTTSAEGHPHMSSTNQPFPVRASTPVDGVGESENLEGMNHKTKILREVYNTLLERYNELRSHHRQCEEVDHTEDFALDTINSGISLFANRNIHEAANLAGDVEENIQTLEEENGELKQRLQSQAESVAKVQVEFQNKVHDFQKLLETITGAKDNIERAMITQREAYEARLERMREEATAAGVNNPFPQELQIAEDQIHELTDKLRMEEEEKNLQKLKISHLTRECKMYEKHIEDLENQVKVQQHQIQEATKEHTESIKLLAEMKLEQDLNRCDQQNALGMINEELQRISQPGTEDVSTNNTDMLLAAPHTGLPNNSTMSVTSQATGYTADDTRVCSNLGPGKDGHKALEIKHFQMIEEIAKLQRENREANECYEREVTLLRETIYRQKQTIRTLQTRLNEGHADMSDINIESMERSEVDESQFITELLGVREKLTVLQKSSKTLKDENTTLKQNMKKQEEVVKKIQRDIESAHDSVSMVSGTPSCQQIALLQEERDELWEKLNNMTEQDEELADMLEDRYRLEQKLQRERAEWKASCQQKGQLEIQLLQERLARERQMRDLRKLEDLIRQKEAIDVETEKMAAGTGTGQLDDKVTGEESVLSRERARLGIVIKQKLKKDSLRMSSVLNIPPTQLFQPIHNAAGQLTRSDQFAMRLGCGCVAETGSNYMHAKCTYHLAIERLKSELQGSESIVMDTVTTRGRSRTKTRRQ